MPKSAKSTKWEQDPNRQGRRCRKAQAGLTLIEVLMSVAILSIGAVVLLGALGNVSHAVDVAEQRSAAYIFSVSKMAELELAFQKGETLASHDGGTSSIGTHRLSWSVTGSAVSDDPQLKRVTLTVTSRAASPAPPQHVETFLRMTLPEPLE